MAEDDDRRRWDEAHSLASEAHRLAQKHERTFYELPDGADKDEVALIVWIVRVVHSYKRMTWLSRLLVVQLPLTLAGMAALYGAGTAIFEAFSWWQEKWQAK